MKRHIITIACSLAMGIALTYLCAWGCIGWLPERGSYSDCSTSYYCAELGWGLGWSSRDYEWVSDAWAADPRSALSGRLVHQDAAARAPVDAGYGWEGDHLERSGGAGWSSESRLYRASFEAGWPMRSVCSRVTALTDAQGNFRRYPDLPLAEMLTRGFPTDRLPTWLGAQPDRRLPLIPLWPGFAINTAAYATATLAVLVVTPRLRRAHRRRAGRCTRCSYDLAASTGPCPECGR